MGDIDIKKFEEILLSEKIILESELREITRGNVNNPYTLETTSDDIDVDITDSNSLSDKFVTMEDNYAITKQLRSQLIEVLNALDRIKKGKYGICEKTGKIIDRKRLAANPSARFAIIRNKK
ncbi:MAG TPA: TraR/DksA C4-type zinc finger protein [Candidatus Paceibacterota bacterium]|jgi:RNA polymerase-binding transcription factor DksA|nr:TraR/DksA C4-type zinc finger protein [Candidatus Paceibacterota bacterium]